MKTLKADEVRIPREAREAVARHEEVVVMNRERPALLILNPDDRAGRRAIGGAPRRLREALDLLAAAPTPDEAFGDDLEAVLADVGDAAEPIWEHS